MGVARERRPHQWTMAPSCHLPGPSLGQWLPAGEGRNSQSWPTRHACQHTMHTRYMRGIQATMLSCDLTSELTSRTWLVELGTSGASSGVSADSASCPAASETMLKFCAKHAGDAVAVTLARRHVSSAACAVCSGRAARPLQLHLWPGRRRSGVLSRHCDAACRLLRRLLLLTSWREAEVSASHLSIARRQICDAPGAQCSLQHHMAHCFLIQAQLCTLLHQTPARPAA